MVDVTCEECGGEGYHTIDCQSRGGPTCRANGRSRSARARSTALAADVLGTNHRATHLIVTKTATTTGRGLMYHDPSGWGRTPDHARVKLGDGKTWYRLVKNTVPETSDRTTRVTGMNQSGQSRAWTIGGSVD
jgi:hypothetical protein